MNKSSKKKKNEGNKGNGIKSNKIKSKLVQSWIKTVKLWKNVRNKSNGIMRKCEEILKIQRVVDHCRIRIKYAKEENHYRL